MTKNVYQAKLSNVLSHVNPVLNMQMQTSKPSEKFKSYSINENGKQI